MSDTPAAPARPVTLDTLEDTLRRVLMGTGLVVIDAVEDAAAILAGRVWQNLPAAAPVTDAGLPTTWCPVHHAYDHCEDATLAAIEAAAPAPDAGLREAELAELLREAIEEVHHTGLLTHHSDPNDKTGWNVRGIETCADPLCVASLAALSRQAEKETA